MKISLVVAVSENQVIGKDNQLLWRLPNDMKFFKNTTWAMPVIMGRKTFASLGKALKGRTNIVITRNPSWSAEGVQCAPSLEQALVLAQDTDALEVFVIGGGEIYREAMPLAHRIYLTRVHAAFEGDTYFPVLESSDWKKVSELDFTADEQHAYAYSFQVWERR
jgi:dihydrofolate reductase